MNLFNLCLLHTNLFTKVYLKTQVSNRDSSRLRCFQVDQDYIVKKEFLFIPIYLTQIYIPNFNFLS